MVQDGIYYALEEVNKRLEKENEDLRNRVKELEEEASNAEKEFYVLRDEIKEPEAEKNMRERARKEKVSTKPKKK